MKIDSGLSSLIYAQRTGSIGSARAFTVASTSSPVPGPKVAGSSDIRQTDFTSMTRQEMRDWVNAQVKSGAMSLDESTSFVGMTMKIPVKGENEIPAEGDTERIDFVCRIQGGIQGALSRSDVPTLRMLQAALDTVQQHQGEAVGVDIHA